MATRNSTFLAALLLGLLALTASAQAGPNQGSFPPTYVPSGAQLYKQYCETCHGANGKGFGPAAESLKRPPADLTTLAARHEGKFPYEYVSQVLLFGPGMPSHGTPDMPAWGPIFMFMDKRDETAVHKRIKNLSDYLASMQVGKKSGVVTPTAAHN